MILRHVPRGIEMPKSQHQGRFCNRATRGLMRLVQRHTHCPHSEALDPVVASVMASWRTVVASHLPHRTRARRESFAGLVISAIEGAYIRGRAERTRTAFVEAGEWLARLIEQEAG
jgi:hypothetical protein